MPTAHGCWSSRLTTPIPGTVVAVVNQTVQELGRFFIGSPLEEATVDQAGRLWAVDVRAVLVASQAAAWNMSEGGRIITMGSALADRVPVPGMTLYAMAKSAFTGLIRAWPAIWPSAGSLSPWYMAASSTPT